jgi:hypothetical protein
MLLFFWRGGYYASKQATLLEMLPVQEEKADEGGWRR